MTPSAEPTPAPQDPWDRYGWVMSAIWLLFLGFPIAEAIIVDRPVGLRVAAVGTMLVFAGVYIYAFRILGRAECASDVTRNGRRFLIVLGALTLLCGALVGPAALGTTPFLAAVAMFMLPLRQAGLVVAALVGAAALIPLATDEPWEGLLFAGIVVTVAAATGTIRILDDRSKEQRRHAEEIALVSERDRVARDVHDVLGHSLTVVNVKAQLAQKLVDADPERAKAELGEIQALASQALGEIRATVSGLRVPRLDQELLAAADALSGAGIDAELSPDASVVDPRHRLVVAWALREAVTNVIRHSGARRCRVELEPDGLVVTDDGRGVEPGVEGNGLRGLRERVKAAGGTVTLDRGAAGGTSLQVRL